MRWSQNIAPSRRRRFAALLGVAGMLTYSAAGAQADGDWLETALEKTLRLSSPWELPIMPQLDPTALPNASSIGPDAPAETKIVLEVPWGMNAETETPSDASSADRLVIHLVDDFEDPWISESSDSSIPSGDSSIPSGDSPGADDARVRAQVAEQKVTEKSAEALELAATNPELIYPWTD